MGNFANLHCHSEFSFLDGLSRVEEMAARAAELGQPAVALTDHGEVNGHLAFQKACRDKGIHPVFGMEGYWSVDINKSREEKTRGRDNSHIVLLAKDQVGLRNLWAWSSKAYEANNFYSKPQADLKMMKEYSEGLYASDGCFAGEEKYLTSEGTKTFAETVGTTQKVLGHSANWVDAEIRSFGVQQIYRLVLTRYGRRKEIFTTANHRWLTSGYRFPSGTLRKGHKGDEKLTVDLSVGDTLRTTFSRKYTSRVTLCPTAIQAGIVFGDGTTDHKGSRRSARVKLYGEKDAQLLKWFPLHSSTQLFAENAVEVRGLPGYFKDAPSLSDSTLSYLYWWLSGYFAADGCISDGGVARLSSASRENLVCVQDVCQLLGIKTGSICEQVATKTVPQGKTYEDVSHFYVTLSVRDVGEEFFLVEEHRQRAARVMTRDEKAWSDWAVVSVEPTDRIEEVFCAVVPNGHAFTLADNILTGNCLLTEFARNVAKGDEPAAREIIGKLLGVFGENFYMELHPWQFVNPQTEEEISLTNEMRVLNQAKVRIAGELGVPLVVVNDAHYAKPEQWENHALIWDFNTGNPDQRGRGQTAAWMMSEEELVLWMSKHGVSRSVTEEAIKNSFDIAQNCVAEISPTLEMPRLSASERDDFLALESAVKSAFAEREWDNPDLYRERIDNELKVIHDKGFAGYFNIVADYVKAAKTGVWRSYVSPGAQREKLLVGPGRGSAGGCLVAYLMGITSIDSVKHGLIFERFINPGRKDFPDIDVDVPQSRRQEVRDYLGARYGHDHVCHIGTRMRSAPKGTLADLCRVMGISFADRMAMSAIIDEVNEISDEDSVGWDEVLTEMGGELAPWVRKYPKLFDKMGEMVGLARQAGTHASGILISNRPLLGTLPTRVKNDLVVSQFDMHEVEHLGAVKLDLLGLRHLDTLMVARELIYEQHGVWVDYESMDSELEEPAIWADMEKGETVGIFQIETPSGSKVTKDFKPKSMTDVADLLSINRPGVIRAGMLEHYLRRRHGLEAVSYDHPLMSDIVGGTYGVLVYQEQLIQACRTLAGFSLSEADELRKLIGKKLIERLGPMREKFVAGCLANPEFMSAFTKRADPMKSITKIWASFEAAGSYCVVGSTEIKLSATNSPEGGRIAIEDLWRRLYDLDPPGLGKHGGPCRYGCDKPAVEKGRGQCKSCCAWRQKFKYRGLSAWSLGEDGRLHPNRITDVYRNGVQGVWKVTLADGNSITATADHQHMTLTGWRQVHELSVGDELLVCGQYEKQTYEPEKVRTTSGQRSYAGARLANSDRHADASLGYIDGGYLRLKEWTGQQDWSCSLDGCSRSRDFGDRIERAHLDGNRKNNDPSNLLMLCASHHKEHDYRVNRRRVRGDKGYPAIPTRIVSIEYMGEEMVYDLAMASPRHSWVGNGIVTHNCFNKSHAIGYATISSWEIWTKHHYPKEFIVALMQTDSDNINRYVREARKRGLEIYPPDINVSDRKFTLEHDGIRYGLDTIRGVGPAAVSDILKNRPFKSLNDLVEKGSGRGAGKKSVIINLIKIGALDSIGPRQELMEDFCASRKDLSDEPIPDFSDEKVIYEIEKELVGNYVTVDPMARYIKPLEAVCIQHPDDMKNYKVNDLFCVGGMITKIKHHKTKTNKDMAFIAVSWNESEFDLLAFPEVWSSIKNIVKVGSPVACQVIRLEKGCCISSVERLDLLLR